MTDDKTHSKTDDRCSDVTIEKIGLDMDGIFVSEFLS